MERQDKAARDDQIRVAGTRSGRRLTQQVNDVVKRRREIEARYVQPGRVGDRPNTAVLAVAAKRGSSDVAARTQRARELAVSDRLVFAQGSTFAPFAVRPAESTATSSSMAARCLRMLPMFLTEKEKKRHSISKYGYSKRQEGIAAKNRQRMQLERDGVAGSMVGIGMSMDQLTSGHTAELTANSMLHAGSS